MIWYWTCKMSLAVKNFITSALIILALGSTALAQVKTGEANLNLNGTVSGGYTNDTNSTTGSDHSIFGAGQADLSGFYYNPNFLSFDVQPFYNQSRLNSSSQSLTAASGVSAGAHFFGGSAFPGSISYSTTYNNTGNYGIPGLANYTTNGNSSVLALNWGVHYDDLPTVNFSFADTAAAYSVYGANSQGTLHSDIFSVASAYRVAGFHFNGGYQYSDVHTITPEFLEGTGSEDSRSGTGTVFFGLSHDLPMNGTFSAGASHQNITTEYGDTSSAENYDTSIDTVNAALSFSPTRRFHLGANAYYTDNLEGTLYNTLLNSGVQTPENLSQGVSHDLNFTANANYDLPAEHTFLHALYQHQAQSFLGEAFSSDSETGEAIYSNTIKHGQFNGVLGVTHTTISITGQSLTGINTSANYTHQLHQWTMTGGFGYSQDSTTVLAAYTTSGYNYNAALGRRLWRRSYWSLNAGGMRSLLTGNAGTANDSQSYSTSFSVPRFSINGAYAHSSGNALLTSTGLVNTPIPVSALPIADVVFFKGDSYSFGVGAHPLRGLSLSANFAKALSNTDSNSTLSNNNNEDLIFMITYHVRKLDFQTGYSRLAQGFSVAGTPPVEIGSFYVGISRYFNFF